MIRRLVRHVWRTGGETWALWMWSREKVRGVSHLRDRM